MDRKYSFAVLLVVVAVSVVFGMILGGRLNAPATMLAATDTAWLEKPQEATLAQSMLVVGSAPLCSSPTSASRAVSSMALVGLVWVSE